MSYHNAVMLLATKYDSGMGTVDYTCDKCQTLVQSTVLPPGWREEGGEHICPQHSQKPSQKQPGGRTGCAICGSFMPDIEVAIDAGWIPSFWVDKRETGPACPECESKYLMADDDGTIVLRDDQGSLAPDIDFV